MSFGKRKGITPVIAIVLLLMMTVAAAGLAYTWVIGVQKEAQAGITEQIMRQQQVTRASIGIDTAWNETGNLSFILSNKGQYIFTEAEVSEFNVYINGKPGLADESIFTGVMSIGKSLEVNTTSPWPGQFDVSLIRVTTPIEGAEAIKSCSPAGKDYC